MRAPWFHVALCAAALGCAETPAPPSSDSAGAGGHLPYEGVAFPSRRASIPAPAGGLGLVANARSDSLSAVDAGGGAVLKTLPVGRDPVTPDNPIAIAAHPDSGAVYVLLAFQDLHAHLHAGSGSHAQPSYVQKLALSDLAILGEVELPEEPRGLAISADGSRLVTAHWSSPGELAAQMTPDALQAARGRLSVIDTATIEPVFSEGAAFGTACIGARAVALTADGSRAFVACFDEDAIAVLDLSAAGFPRELVPAGPEPGLPGLPAHGPAALALSPDGATLFFANELTGEVRALDATPGALSATHLFTAQGTPVALAAGEGGALYLLTREPASVLRLPVAPGGPELEERPLPAEDCAAPAAMALSNTGRILIACSGGEGVPGSVVALDASTLALLGSSAVGVDPRAIAIVPGGAP